MTIRSKGPNILLVVFDTARADAFEPYGAPAGASSAVDQMARDGTALLGYAPSCWTVPSHIGMFSGLLPRSAGLATGPLKGPEMHRAAIANLAEAWLPSVLARNGYDTAAASTNGWVTEPNGFAAGFDRFEWIRSRRPPTGHHRFWPQKLHWDLHALRSRADDGAQMVDGLLADWQAIRPHRPFFWFVNLIECHSPYLPPHPYNPLSMRERWQAGADAARYLTFEALTAAALQRAAPPELALERMRALYAGAVRLLDDWLARLLERLDRDGILDDTLVIVTSDHGENLGEGGRMGHGFSLDERLLRVPLVLRGPSAGSLDAARACPMSLLELPSIVTAAAGISDHPWSPTPRTGIAVAQFEPPALASEAVSRQVSDRLGLDEAQFALLTGNLSAATDGQRKLLRAGSTDFVVDLENDPDEVAPRPLTVAQQGEPAWRALQDSVTAYDEASVPPAAAPADASARQDAELEAQLRLLGYL